MLENQYQYEFREAGCDEAGRGCLAGPVFAAAVILPPDFHDPLLNDSKQMTERNRDRLRLIIEREAVAWAVEAVSAARIDEINILNASFEGMSLAVARLDPPPEFLAIDGNRFRTRLELIKTTLLFFATALCEIIGCFLPWLWLKRNASIWLLLPAGISLALFVWLLTLHPAASGRVYAAYGGVYVCTALRNLKNN